MSTEKKSLNRRQMLALSAVGGVGLVVGESRADDADGADLNRRPSLTTRLTREYGIRFPFVGAGMGFVAVPALVAAVSNAGGLGVLGNAIEPPPGTRALVQAIRALTDKPFGVDFIFDESALGPLVTDAHIDVCVDERVPVVVFHMNVPPRRWVEALHKAGTRVWMQAASVEQASDAVALGIDVVIAQGAQAGGHNKSVTPTLELLSRIVRTVRPRIVLAAGGIADGASVVRALTHGADGVWVGTRLVASVEAYANQEYKRRIVTASGAATVTTTLFGPEYPNRPYRVLRNRVVNEWAGKESEVPTPPPPPAVIGTTLLFPQTNPLPYDMPKFSAIVPTPDTVGDFEEMGLPAGSESVRLIKRIQPAGEIVRDMMNEARQLLAETPPSPGASGE